jgi:hypothetical protein
MVTNKNIDDFDSQLDELLRLPRFSPSPDFSDRVMSQVAVFQRRALSAERVSVAVPPAIKAPAQSFGWSVPPVLTRWIPASRPARYALATVAAMSSVATTAVAAVAITQFRLVSFLTGVAFERMTVALTVWGADLVNAALGQTVLGYLNTAAPAQSALVMGGLAAGGIAAFGGLKKAASLTSRTI